MRELLFKNFQFLMSLSSQLARDASRAGHPRPGHRAPSPCPYAPFDPSPRFFRLELWDSSSTRSAPIGLISCRFRLEPASSICPTLGRPVERRPLSFPPTPQGRLESSAQPRPPLRFQIPAGRCPPTCRHRPVLRLLPDSCITPLASSPRTSLLPLLPAPCTSPD